MEKEKGKQSKLEKIKSFKEGYISQGKDFSPELDSGLKLEFIPPFIEKAGFTRTNVGRILYNRREN